MGLRCSGDYQWQHVLASAENHRHRRFPVVGHPLVKTLFLGLVTILVLVLPGPWHFHFILFPQSGPVSSGLKPCSSLQSHLCVDKLDQNRSASLSPDLPLSSWILQHAGPISPYHRMSTYEPPPKDCKVVQVNQLQRHGSRYPTPKVSRRIQAALRKLKKSTHFHKSLEFIPDYQYRLGESSLIPLGASESLQAGTQFAVRYKHLIHPESLPFIRTSLSQRVVDSANNFSLALLSQLGHPEIDPIKPLLISEDPKMNNTLDNNSCPNRKTSLEKRQWLRIFGRPITKRLNRLAINAHLNDQNTMALMQLCVFETFFHNELSRFCQIFHKDDWPGFAYYFDLDKYYGHGTGNNLAGIEGLGYVSELFSRLTGDRNWASKDQSKVNHTLDQSDSTFPLDRHCYIDFSHDNQMISILSALGILTKEGLPATGPQSQDKNWDVSKWMPFASRLTVEKLVCHGNPTELVRFFLNDKLMDLPIPPQTDGLSSLQNNFSMYPIDRFIQHKKQALTNSGNLYRQCFINSDEVKFDIT